MYKVIPAPLVHPEAGPTSDFVLPAGNEIKQNNADLLVNIVETTSLVLKNICENTNYEIINNSELGNLATKSLIATRLIQKLKDKTAQDFHKL